jgi:hypothetical protein
MTAATLAVSLIGQALAAARGLFAKSAIKLIFYSWRRFAGCKALILFIWRGGFYKNVVPRYMRFRLTL